MKRAVVTVSAVIAVAFTFSTARADAEGNVNFFLGEKSLSSDWEPFESQFEFGAVMDFGQEDWPVSIAADLLSSVDETDFLIGWTIELDAGVRKIWKKGTIFPYVGGGIAVIGAGLDRDAGGFFASVDAQDVGFGLWAGTGVFFRIGSHFNIGLDVRYSRADVDFDFGSGAVEQNVNAGGFSYGLLLGFGW